MAPTTMTTTTKIKKKEKLLNCVLNRKKREENKKIYGKLIIKKHFQTEKILYKIKLFKFKFKSNEKQKC